jgi:hypothetical protein
MAKKKKLDKDTEIVSKELKKAWWCKRDACNRYQMLKSPCPHDNCYYVQQKTN